MQYEKSGIFAFMGRRDELCIRNLNTQLHDRMITAMKKYHYSLAPLPFVGQKRMFASEFRKVLKRFSDRTVFVDLFGGSGLLSHITKRVSIHTPTQGVTLYLITYYKSANLIHCYANHHYYSTS